MLRLNVQILKVAKNEPITVFKLYPKVHIA